MKHLLLRSNSFVRSARRVLRKNAGASEDIRIALHLMEEDTSHPLLKTHKLQAQGEIGGVLGLQRWL